MYAYIYIYIYIYIDMYIHTQEESKAIWSERFIKKYGNPHLMVMDPKDQLKIILSQKRRGVSSAYASSLASFRVIKRLNAMEDGERVLVIDKYVYMYVCVCVCVCMYVDTLCMYVDTHTNTHTHTHTYTYTYTHVHAHTETPGRLSTTCM